MLAVVDIPGHSGLMIGVSLIFGKPVKNLNLTNTTRRTHFARQKSYLRQKIESSQGGGGVFVLVIFG